MGGDIVLNAFVSNLLDPRKTNSMMWASFDGSGDQNISVAIILSSLHQVIDSFFAISFFIP
jgi:hypothetical protein